MAVMVEVDHDTTYRFTPAVAVHPHVLRLRPATHAPGLRRWDLALAPASASVTWEVDDGWWSGRLVVAGTTDALTLRSTTTLAYEALDPHRTSTDPTTGAAPTTDAGRTHDVAPAANTDPALAELVAGLPPLLGAGVPAGRQGHDATIERLSTVATRVAEAVTHQERHDRADRSPVEVLRTGTGSCRDSAAVLAAALAATGLRSRVVTGLLVQLADEADLVGPWADPRRPSQDTSVLHAWAEAHVDGRGWVGLDPTSGRPTGGGHLPFACAHHRAPVPVAGSTDPCQVELSATHTVRRLGGVDGRPG